MKTFILLASLFLVQNSGAVEALPSPADASAQPGMMGKMQGVEKPADMALLAKHPDEGACRKDIETLCKGVKPGHGNVIKCLKDHEAQLSPECKAKGETMKENFKEKRQEIREACKDDFKSICAGINVPRERLACLKAHESKLSESCKKALPSAHQE